MQRHRIAFVLLGRIDKGLGDQLFCVAEDNPSLAFALSLRLSDIASCRLSGILISRISTELTVMPHGVLRASIAFCKASSTNYG